MQIRNLHNIQTNDHLHCQKTKRARDKKRHLTYNIDWRKKRSFASLFVLIFVQSKISKEICTVNSSSQPMFSSRHNLDICIWITSVTAIFMLALNRSIIYRRWSLHCLEYGVFALFRTRHPGPVPRAHFVHRSGKLPSRISITIINNTS